MEIDQDIENCDEMEKVAAALLDRSKSIRLFDLNLDGLSTTKLQKTEYADNLEKEAREWKELLKEKISDIKKIESENIVISKDVLSDEQIAYIDGSHNFSNILKESEKFSQKMVDFINLHADTMEMYEALGLSVQNVISRRAIEAVYSWLNS